MKLSQEQLNLVRLCKHSCNGEQSFLAIKNYILKEYEYNWHPSGIFRLLIECIPQINVWGLINNASPQEAWKVGYHDLESRPNRPVYNDLDYWTALCYSAISAIRLTAVKKYENYSRGNENIPS